MGKWDIDRPQDKGILYNNSQEVTDGILCYCEIDNYSFSLEAACALSVLGLWWNGVAFLFLWDLK
jgi:hypothetical protein